MFSVSFVLNAHCNPLSCVHRLLIEAFVVLTKDDLKRSSTVGKGRQGLVVSETGGLVATYTVGTELTHVYLTE